MLEWWIFPRRLGTFLKTVQVEFPELNFTYWSKSQQQQLVYSFIHRISSWIHFIRIRGGHFLECVLMYKTQVLYWIWKGTEKESIRQVVATDRIEPVNGKTKCANCFIAVKVIKQKPPINKHSAECQPCIIIQSNVSIKQKEQHVTVLFLLIGKCLKSFHHF